MTSRLQNFLRRNPIRRGFSFTEVLFAVMILGVGFIMIAAIFPVAIQQAQNTSSEGSAAAIARGAVATVQQSLQKADIPDIMAPTPRSAPVTTPPTPGRGRVYSFKDPQGIPRSSTFGNWLMPNPGWTQPDQLWAKTKGSQILPNDPRYGWVGLFRREFGSPYAQVFIIVTQARIETAYDAARDLTPLAGRQIRPPIANLQARPVQVLIRRNPTTSVYEAIFSGPAAGAVAEGAYFIIANDNLDPKAGNTNPPQPWRREGWMNGRMYRVANRVNGNVWDLMPGSDFTPDAGPDGQFATGAKSDDVNEIGPRPADAFVVGRTYVGGDKFDGPAQDVAVYTTFIQLSGN